MRSVWSGVINFGMVSIGIELTKATQRHQSDFHQHHRQCEGRINQQRRCNHCDTEVAWEDVVKGVEVSNGGVVILDDDDLAGLEPQRSKSIEVDAFVEKDAIPPLAFNQAYYIRPTTSSQKAYRLLYESLQHTERVAVGSFVLKNREHPVAICPLQGRLCALTLEFAENILDPDDDLDASVAEPTEMELELAEKLITALAVDTFDLGQYQDHYHASLVELVSAKAAGKPLQAPPDKPIQERVEDLMETLSRSIEAVTKTKKKAEKNA